MPIKYAAMNNQYTVPSYMNIVNTGFLVFKLFYHFIFMSYLLEEMWKYIAKSERQNLNELV